MRGLAESGQANIAEVQSQAAYGETLSGLYGQKQAVEQQAVTQSQLIEQSVAAATTEANIQRATQQLQSDQQLFNEVQAIEDNKKAQVASLVELAMSGEYTPKQLQQLSDAYGISGEELTTVMNASSYFDPTGDLKMKETWNWDEIGKLTSIGAGTGATVGAISGNPLLAGAAGLIGGALGLAFAVGGEIGKQLANEVRNVYRISPGQGYEDITGTKPEVIKQIRQRYQNFEGSSEILVDLQKGLTGIGSDKIVFIYEGKSYNTYNEALKALRART